jgi:glycosyltransferase involved in cell wall biosynthesis
MIHVGFLIDIIGHSPGGTEKQLLTLIRNISHERFRVFLYVLKSSDLAGEWAEPCSLEQLHVDSLRSPSTVLKLRKLRRLWINNGIQILQTQFAESNVVGVALGKSAGIRDIITTRRNQEWQTRAEIVTQRVMNRFARLVVVNSTSTKGWVMEREGVPEEKIRVVYNAIEVDEYSNVDPGVSEGVRARLNIPPSAQIVGICANLRPVKSIGTLLHAAAEVVKVVPGVRFLVIGEGDEDGEEGRLKALAQSLGVAERVLFLGRRRDVPELLSTMDVGVLCSRSESMPNSVAEYMAAGLPVVSTDVGGVSELVEEGINGFLVSVGDSHTMARRILEILTTWRDFPAARNAEKIGRLCDVRQIAHQYEDIYESLVSKSVSTRPGPSSV